MDEKLKKHGAISWSELITSDVEGAKSYYQELFGWTFIDTSMEHMVYSSVKINDEEVAGIMPKTSDCGDMPSTWGLYVTVDDVNATAEKAVSLGGKVCMPPQEIPNVGTFCVLEDPQGAYISIISYLE